MTTLDHALAQAALGRYVFPLRPGTKLPYKDFHWTIESTTNPDTIREWFEKWPKANYGIDCGKSKLAVIDEDIKDGKVGDQTLIELELDHEDLPPTVTIQTPSGGRQFYFSGVIPSTVSTKGLGLDVDTRGRGGYVVGPGSTIGANAYTVTSNGTPVAPVPEWVVNLLAHRVSTQKKPQEPLIELDQEHHIAQAITYLEQAEGAEDGKGGDHHTITVAAKLKDLGISEEMAVELMLEHWDDKCSPPWGPDGIALKVRNAYRHCTDKAPGEDTAEAVFADIAIEYAAKAEVEKEQKKTKIQKHLDAIRATRFLDNKPEPVRYLLKDSLPVATVGLHTAQGGTGKSTLLQQLEMDVAGIANSMDNMWEVTEHGSVYAIHAEDPDNILHTRAEDIASEFSPFDHDPKNQIYRGKWGDWYCTSGTGQDLNLMEVKDKKLAPSAFFYELLEILKSIPNLKLVVLDPLARFDQVLGGSSDPNIQATFLVTLLERIALATGANVIVAHHHNKGASQAPDKSAAATLTQESSRGASAYVDNTRWTLAMATAHEPDAKAVGLKASDAKNIVMMRVVKKNYGPPEDIKYLKRSQKGVLRLLTSKPMPQDKLAAIIKTKDLIMELVTNLEAKGTYLTKRTIARDYHAGWKLQHEKISEGLVKSALAELINDGYLMEDTRKNSQQKNTEYVVLGEEVYAGVESAE